MAKNYDPKSVFVTVAGFLCGGFADGAQVSITRNREDWTLGVGNDGEATRSKQNDKSGQITISLMQSSSTCNFFDTLRKTDELTGLGQIPILIKDLYGTTLVYAQQAWLRKPADLPFGREAASQEYVFESGNIEITDGGNL